MATNAARMSREYSRWSSLPETVNTTPALPGAKAKLLSPDVNTAVGCDGPPFGERFALDTLPPLRL